MRAGVLWLASFAILPAAGAPLLTHRGYRIFPPVARLVLSGAVGAVLLSFVMTVSAILGVRWNIPLLALTAAGLSALLRLAVRPDSPGAAEFPAPPSGVSEHLAPALAGAAVAAALAATLAGAAGSTDLLFFWGPKAQAFASARTIDAGFLASPRASYMHSYYPPLVTNLCALASMVAGRFAWGAASLTFPLLLAAIALALPSSLRLAERPVAPRSVSALVVAALALLGFESEMAGNADPWLLFFEILGLALLLAPKPHPPQRLLLAGLLFAGAVCAKVEGLPFVAAAVLFFIAFDHSLRPLAGRLFLLVAPAAASLGAWFLFGFSRKAFAGYGEYGSLLELRWERFGLVLATIGRSLWNAGFALPYLVPLAVLLAARGGVRRLPLAVAAALTAFLAVTYMLPVRDPVSWIAWSAARTFAPVAALLALALGARRGHPKHAMAHSSESPEIQSPATKERGP